MLQLSVDVVIVIVIPIFSWRILSKGKRWNEGNPMLSTNTWNKARSKHRGLRALVFSINVWVLSRPLVTIKHWRNRRLCLKPRPFLPSLWPYSVNRSNLSAGNVTLINVWGCLTFWMANVQLSPQAPRPRDTQLDFLACPVIVLWAFGLAVFCCHIRFPQKPFH